MMTERRIGDFQLVLSSVEGSPHFGLYDGLPKPSPAHPSFVVTALEGHRTNDGSSWTAPLSSSPLPQNSETHVRTKQFSAVRILGERAREKGNPFHDAGPLPLSPSPKSFAVSFIVVGEFHTRMIWGRGDSNCRKIHRRDRRRSGGYVLLVVIAVSVLVITALGTLAKISLRRGLEAADAERSLQQRWGSYTLERALLAEAPGIFQRREEQAASSSSGPPPPPVIRSVLSLRGVTFDLLLADEDAKLNLNSYYHLHGPDRTRRVISSVAGGQAVPAIRLSPAVRPAVAARGLSTKLAADRDEEDVPPEAFRSWGEVFDIDTLSAQLGGDAALPNLTTGLTCWGSGQLNMRRATDQAILAVAASVVQDGGARRLLKRYRDSRVGSLSTLLQTEVSSPRNREALADLLTETSTNFSIWIDASTRSRPSMRTFTVMRRDEEGVTRQTKFLH